MLKKLVLITISMLITLHLYCKASPKIFQPKSALFYPAHQKATITGVARSLEKVERSRISFFFDLHDVVSERQLIEGTKQFLAQEKPTKRAKAKFFGRILKTLINPIAIGSIVLKAITGEKKRHVYYASIAKYSSKHLAHDALVIGNYIYKPNTKMITLILKLKEKGYTVHLLSNACYNTMALLKRDSRFKELFSGDNPVFIDNSINFDKDSNTWLLKPDARIWPMVLERRKVERVFAFFVDNTHSKMPHWSNKKFTAKYPHFQDFWNCILYDINKHEEFENLLTRLGLL